MLGGGTNFCPTLVMEPDGDSGADYLMMDGDCGTGGCVMCVIVVGVVLCQHILWVI
jgi:hypothetical protein